MQARFVETERFGAANTDLTNVSITVGRWMAAIFPAVMLVMNLSSVAVLWFGGLRVDAGAMQIGSLTAFLSYLVQILMAVMMSTFMLMLLPRASVSAANRASCCAAGTRTQMPQCRCSCRYRLSTN